MGPSIDKNIQQKASKCPHGYICQQPGGKPCCKVTESINDSVFFTKSRNPLGCPYQHSFGSAHMCTCPVRIEMFRKNRS